MTLKQTIERGKAIVKNMAIGRKDIGTTRYECIKPIVSDTNTKNNHDRKIIVYGHTGYGKSYVIISNILRERENQEEVI